MHEYEIASVGAREILDCRLEPTLQVTVRTAGGHEGRADVPAGRSTGRHEALDLRDGDDRYRGRGVREAVANVEDRIAPELEGRDVREQRAIDEALIDLDGTAQKSNLGGNAITGTSLAVLKAAAAVSEEPLYCTVIGGADPALPIPFLDVIEGGELAATNLAFQEHQLVPVGAETFADAIRMAAEVYYELGDLLAAEWGRPSRNVGVEGGYTPPDMADPRDAFDAMLAAVEEVGYDDAFVLAIDAAATHFYDPDDGRYTIMDQKLTREGLMDLYDDLASAYPLRSIEDPFYEDDFEGTAALTDALGIQIIGDDLFVTNPERLERGIDAGVANALLLKVNQVGTVTEAADAFRLATENGYHVQVSERSGQTPDTWLADLTVGLGAGQIKTGVSRGERTDQYNRLLRIEEELEPDAGYATWPTAF